MSAIIFHDVWETYRIKFVIGGKTIWEDFPALRGVSFEIGAGETVGIIGENGAGKSTILKLIMGMLTPDRGKVGVTKKAAGLLELGAGFQPELTGRENVFLSAGLFGLSRKEAEARFDDIADFAEIGKFIDAPVKCYSQGMFVRLAFAIAIHMDADILVIDDTLAVGDEYFQKKCIKKIFELKDRGTTIVLVTHAMQMLHRLCARAIFLKDGVIVKDDTTARVLPLYTQMVGSKEGVGTLEKGSLRTVFNNGRLFLNWDGRLLTPHSGAYTTFLVGNKWYSSLQADWEVQKEGDNKLTATGRHYQLEMTQVWQFEVNDRQEISWDIELESADPLEIQEGYTNILVADEYTDWFTTSEKGGFPPIAYENKNWQPLLNGMNSAGCIGVAAKDDTAGRIPSLIFQQSGNLLALSGQILNTDYLTHSRVLQYKTAGLQNYSAAQSGRLMYFSGKIILDTPDADTYIRALNEGSSLMSAGLGVRFNNGKGILSYNGIDVTIGSHIGTSLYADGRWYSSGLAHWDMQKQGDDKIVLTGTWPGLPLIQTWEIKRARENSFFWTVSMQLSGELDIEQQHFYIMSRKEYTHWFSKYGTGRFPEGFLEAEMDMVQQCIPDGDVGLFSPSVEFPALFLRFLTGHNLFAKIFNSNIYNKARLVRMEKVEPEDNVRHPVGRYPCFTAEIGLNKEARICQDDYNVLQDKNMRFQFDGGRGRIFWKGTELTKRLGLYTSIRSCGRWYDSASSALWTIKGKDGNALQASGKWRHLPVSQLWDIALRQDGTLELRITMTVEESIKVDRLQTNLMTSERYSQWMTNNDTGVFPVFKGDASDDWDAIWSGSDGIEYIGVSVPPVQKDPLPDLKFYTTSRDSPVSLTIVNSDLFHRGRVLQCLNAQQQTLQGSDFLYFSGKVIIR